MTAGERFTLVTFLYGEADAAYCDAYRTTHGLPFNDSARRIARPAPAGPGDLRSFRRYR